MKAKYIIFRSKIHGLIWFIPKIFVRLQLRFSSFSFNCLRSRFLRAASVSHLALMIQNIISSIMLSPLSTTPRQSYIEKESY